MDSSNLFYFPFLQSLQEGRLNTLIFLSFQKMFLEKASDICLPACDTWLLWNMLVSPPVRETARKPNCDFTQILPLLARERRKCGKDIIDQERNQLLATGKF